MEDTKAKLSHIDCFSVDKGCYYDGVRVKIIRVVLLEDRNVVTIKKSRSRTSLVAQWLRIHPPMQGTWVRALVREDPTCYGATKPVCHNC